MLISTPSSRDDWLAGHVPAEKTTAGKRLNGSRRGFRCKERVMMQWADQAVCVAAGGHGAAVYHKSGTRLHIESSLNQAREIVDIAELDVFVWRTAN